jgi:simple sugar transport system ATP-binding protein
MRNIHKTFGSLYANKAVDFTLRQGEVHALLGENGAGKSTLMNILYGLYRKDQGEILVQGKVVEFASPRDSIAQGIGMVHQHFMLIPQLTVAQNIFLGLQKKTGFLVNQKAIGETVLALAERFGFCLAPETPVWQLPVGLQQKVEILKLMTRSATILILDEPTAVLTPAESEDLFSSIKQMAKAGFSIVLITHKLEEVFQHCHRVTVLRQGEVVGTKMMNETTKEDLAAMMVGRQVLFEKSPHVEPDGGPYVKVRDLMVKNDKGLRAVQGISFDIRRGEIFGIAGVDGNGQLELGEALAGLRKVDSGTVTVDSLDLTHATPKERITARMAHIPDDRQRKGLILGFSVAENLMLGSHWRPPFRSGIRIDPLFMNERSAELSALYDIRPRDGAVQTLKLSGGNQQKVVVARELSREPRFILAIQPTRGLDIGAMEFVWNRLCQERDQGKSILLVSTDLEEILFLSNRIGIMYEGRFTGIVTPEVDISEIGLCMTGCKDSSEAKGGCLDD